MFKLLRFALLCSLSSCLLSPDRNPAPVGELGWTLDFLEERAVWTDVDNDFGCACCWIGSDEDPQLLISMPSAMGGSGVLIVLDVRTGEVLRTWSAPQGLVRRFGHKLQAIGDVDADGAEDFVVFCWAKWASGDWFGHAIGVSSATGRVLYQVGGFEAYPRGYGEGISSGPFDLDADGLIDFVGAPAGMDGVFDLCSGKDGQVLQRIELGLEKDTKSIDRLAVAGATGQYPTVFFERKFWMRGSNRYEPMLHSESPGGGGFGVTQTLPNRGFAKGFFDLDADGRPELLFERLRQVSGDVYVPRGNVNVELPKELPVFVQDLVALDLDTGEEQRIATLPSWHDGEEWGFGDFSRLGMATVGARRILFCGTPKDDWYGRMVAFEIGQQGPLWVGEGYAGTAHIGAMVSERAVNMDGDWVVAIGDGVSYSGGEANVFLVRVTDGKVLWHLTPEDVFGEVRSRD